MAWANKVAGGFFLLVGLAAVVGAVRLQIGTPEAPQPGFFPFLSGTALMLLSAALIVQDLLGRGSDLESLGQIGPPLFVLLGLVAFVLLLAPVGYVLATALLAVVILLVLGVRRVWVFAIAVPVVSVGSYALFDRLLGLPLPAGPLLTWTGL